MGSPSGLTFCAGNLSDPCKLTHCSPADSLYPPAKGLTESFHMQKCYFFKYRVVTQLHTIYEENNLYFCFTNYPSITSPYLANGAPT